MFSRHLPLLTLLLLAAFRQQSVIDCSKCDCSHFPIDTPECVKCCFSTKITVTATSSTSVTGKPVLEKQNQQEEKFKVGKATKINGQVIPGATATVYYRRVEGEQVATRIDELQALPGALVPGHSPSPPDTCEQLAERLRMLGRQVPPVPENAMKIFFGNSEAYSSQERLVVLKFVDEEALVLQRTTSGMFVSFKVHGPDGKLVAQAVDNNLFINLGDAYRIERADTSDLSLYDKEGGLVLKVQFLNPRVIRILGRFFGPNGESINLTEDEETFQSRTSAQFIITHTCFGGGNGVIEMTANGQILVR
jgi:hypothetical protein